MMHVRMQRCQLRLILADDIAHMTQSASQALLRVMPFLPSAASIGYWVVRKASSCNPVKHMSHRV